MAKERTSEITLSQGTDIGTSERRTHGRTTSWFAAKGGEGILLAAGVLFLGRREKHLLGLLLASI